MAQTNLHGKCCIYNSKKTELAAPAGGGRWGNLSMVNVAFIVHFISDTGEICGTSSSGKLSMFFRCVFGSAEFEGGSRDMISAVSGKPFVNFNIQLSFSCFGIRSNSVIIHKIIH